jgi:hypothetical protein
MNTASWMLLSVRGRIASRTTETLVSTSDEYPTCLTTSRLAAISTNETTTATALRWTT